MSLQGMENGRVLNQMDLPLIFTNFCREISDAFFIVLYPLDMSVEIFQIFNFKVSLLVYQMVTN